MNQDSSFPPMLPPSTELGALLFALMPCLQETYRPLASFAYHMSELTKLKTIPSMPPISALTDINALISDKDILLRSLSFYGRVFHMPLLSTIANLLQALNLYNTYKDILPGLMGTSGDNGGSDSPLGSMAGLFSGLGGLGSLASLGGAGGLNSGTNDILSALGGLSPDLLSSFFSGNATSTSTSNTSSEQNTESTSSQNILNENTEQIFTEQAEIPSFTSDNLETTENMAPFTSPVLDSPDNITSPPDSPDADQTPTLDSTPVSDQSSGDLFDTLSSFLTPEQKQIYEQLMHTD